MNVVVDGLMTHYQRVGRGKIILCLPGWGDTISSFAKLIEDLKDHYSVLALDLPGFGGTQAPTRAWNLEDYARFTADFIKKMKIPEVHGLVAHSYGGATAVVGLGKGMFNAEKLILISSSGIRQPNSMRNVILKGVAKTAKVPLAIVPKRTRNRLRRKFYGAVGSDMLLLPYMEPTFKKIISQDVRRVASSIEVPTLLIYGTSDTQTPISDARLLDEALPNSQLETIDGGEHFLHQDNADQVAKLIKGFLRK